MADKKEYNVYIRFGVELKYTLPALTKEEELNRQLTQSAVDSAILVFMADSDNIDKLLALVFGDDIKLTRWGGEESWEDGMEGTKNDDTG